MLFINKVNIVQYKLKVSVIRMIILTLSGPTFVARSAVKTAQIRKEIVLFSSSSSSDFRIL
jgi:hypothetical protein